MKIPYQHLALRKDGILFASAANTVYAIRDGKVVASWTDEVDPLYNVRKHHKEFLEADASKEAKGKHLPGAGQPTTFTYIRGLHLSRSGEFLIVLTDFDKAAVVFLIGDQGELLYVKRQPFPKRPSSVTTSVDDKDLIIADKFGDVYSVKLLSKDVIPDEQLEPLLGHVSLLTCVDNAVDSDGHQVIVTSDRDEHIRISYFPKTYVIKKWVFGHEEFVTKFVLLPWTDGRVMVSGGGDTFLCSWLWTDNEAGKELVNKVDVDEIVEPFIGEKHLAPAKFQNETKDLKEYCVLDIIALEASQKVVVAFEKVNGLFVFNVDAKKGEMSYEKTVETDEDVVCLATGDGSKLVVSMPTKVQVYDVTTTGEITKGETVGLFKETSTDITKQLALFSLGNLRKRSEH